jgi:hypothetical protein
MGTNEVKGLNPIAGDEKTKLEQKINTHIDTYKTMRSSTYAFDNYLAGDGLLAGKNPRETLCANYCDVESELFGIGTTNLVKPKGPVVPEFNPIKSLNVIDRLPVIIPQPLVVENGQRPMYLN